MQKIILLFLVLILSNSCSSQTKQETITTKVEESHFPKPIGYVNDFAYIFDSLQVDTLQKKIQIFEDQTTNQIAVVTLDSDILTEDNFDKYALELSNFWGVGTKERNNGLTIVLSPKLRKIRINTGLGTEKILTDKICEDILHNIIIPEFKNENYFNGINKAIDEFIKLWK